MHTPYTRTLEFRFGLLFFPGRKYPLFRWVTRKRPDGRYLMRIPKRGARKSDIYNYVNHAYGPEVLVPRGTKQRRYGHKIKPLFSFW